MNLCYSRNGLEFKVKACEMPVTGFQACQNRMVYCMPVTGFDGHGVVTSEQEENAMSKRVKSRMEAFEMPVTDFRMFKKQIARPMPVTGFDGNCVVLSDLATSRIS